MLLLLLVTTMLSRSSAVVGTAGGPRRDLPWVGRERVLGMVEEEHLEVVVEGVVFTGGEAGATTATVQIGVHAHNKPLAPVAAAQISLCATSTVVEEARIWMCHFGPSNKEILI